MSARDFRLPMGVEQAERRRAEPHLAMIEPRFSEILREQKYAETAVVEESFGPLSHHLLSTDDGPAISQVARLMVYDPHVFARRMLVLERTVRALGEQVSRIAGREQI